MRLALSGGGTGGHIYPALAVADEMRKTVPDSAFLYLGTEKGMERDLALRYGIPFAKVRSGGVAGKSVLSGAKGLYFAAQGVFDAVGHLKKFKPDVVLGTGGYASGPALLAAYLLGVPKAIQEQNAVPGKTNKVLSRFSEAVFLGFPGAKSFFGGKAQIYVTGNPLRSDLFFEDKKAAKEAFGLPKDKPTLLLLGGSGGAKTLVDCGVRILEQGLGGWSFLFVTGERYYEDALLKAREGEYLGIDATRTGNIIIKPYVHNMAEAYAAAELAICRGGGMTLAEIAAVGLPAIIVPSPNVAGNHQEYNAKEMEEKGAAVVVKEKGNSVFKVVNIVGTLTKDPKKLAQMSQASFAIGKSSASSEICKKLIGLAGKK